MKYFLMAVIMTLMSPGFSFAQDQCEQDRILSTATVTAKLKDYYIEETSDIPSTATFIVNGKQLDLVVEPDNIEKYFKNRKGCGFKLTYEIVYGWLGDGCDEYQRFVSAKQIK